MILDKYNNTFNEFITKYEEIHINPWHSIQKEKLKFEREYLLSSKPMAIDVLIIKKKYATTLLIIRKKGFIM